MRTATAVFRILTRRDGKPLAHGPRSRRCNVIESLRRGLRKHCHRRVHVMDIDVPRIAAGNRLIEHIGDRAVLNLVQTPLPRIGLRSMYRGLFIATLS